MRISSAILPLLLTSLVALSGCGGDDSSSGSGGNFAPILSGTPPTQLLLGSSYDFTPKAADPDGDLITFSASNLPDWLSIDTTNGHIWGTPSQTDVGTTAEIVIDAFDQKNHTQLPPFQITVVDTAPGEVPEENQPPTIAGVPGSTATVGKVYTFAPTASDPDDDDLTFTATRLPDWATFTPSTGSLSGTPTSADVGTYSGIVITVSDGEHQVSLPAFTITVGTAAPENRPPTLEGTPSTNVTAGSVYSFRPVASDPDGDSLIFTIQNKPSWATFSATTGRLRGTPGSGNVGTTARITITVSDGELSTSLPSFSIQVAAPPNATPTISGTPPKTVTAGSAYSFTPTASDPEGAQLTFTIQNKPGWANFSASSGRLSGTPVAANVGSYEDIVIGVSDGTSIASLPAFTITVNSASNAPPTISGTPLLSVNVGSAYSFTPTASDPEGAKLTFSISNKPGWATFSSTNGSLTGTPGAANVGVTTNVVIRVSDGTNTVSLPAFAITVVAVGGGSTGSATLTWDAPTTNSDGSTLTDLAGYRVNYGRSSTQLDQTVQISNPGLTTYTIDDLASGTWYFAIRAYSDSGNVSEASNIASKTIP
ncbi:MAG TPA: putative Ig domain-containing protein [Steroidobacteraceae bacterium]|nr:putative Ig domain-containing protein [Steroidobacteraceae bacterium]